MALGSQEREQVQAQGLEWSCREEREGGRDEVKRVERELLLRSRVCREGGREDGSNWERRGLLARVSEERWVRCVRASCLTLVREGQWEMLREVREGQEARVTGPSCSIRFPLSCRVASEGRERSIVTSRLSLRSSVTSPLSWSILLSRDSRFPLRSRCWREGRGGGEGREERLFPAREREVRRGREERLAQGREERRLLSRFRVCSEVGRKPAGTSDSLFIPRSRVRSWLRLENILSPRFLREFSLNERLVRE